MCYPHEIMLEKTANEPQTMCGLMDDPRACPGFRDLRPLLDDKTVLRNPNKGWFWHYIDNGFLRPEYRAEHDENDALQDFPGLNHLYLRFDWGDIEQEKGVYRFDRLEEIMQRWGDRGYTFSMRVCTYEAMNNPETTVPAYVYEEGARCYRLPNGCLQPDFADPIFLKYLEKFMAALGARYDGDPRIECVDIGTIGTWGEGHTVEGDERIYPMDVIKKHMDLHTKYFPHTFLVCNDDHIAGRMYNGAAEMQEMLDYADARGFSVQDDSICCDGYTQENNYDTMRACWAFDRLQHNGPNVIEMAIYTYIKPRYEEHFRAGFTVIEALKNSHATFAGFHGYPRMWLKNEKWLTEYCANRLGYWYFITGIQAQPLQNTAHNMVRLAVENRGWAQAHHRYQLRLALKGEGTFYPVDVEADNRTWLPGQPQWVNLRMDCRGIPAGEYTLCVGMFAGERPVRLALKESCYADGYYTLCPVSLREV